MSGARLLLLAWLSLAAPAALAQAPKAGPPPLEDFETDADKDGVPDGWYNLRDAKLVKGGVVGPTCLRFEIDRPSRPARISRAFAVDGKATEALILGLWIRGEDLQTGERLGEEAGLLIDFLGEQIKAQGRGTLGPWDRDIGKGWVRVARRLPVPPGTREAIMTVGLLGATGVLEIDGMTIEAVPRGGVKSTNLLLNGDLELGDPEPASWLLEEGARRVSPGHRSDSALELARQGAKGLIVLGQRVDRFAAVDVAMMVRGKNLAGGGAQLFFIDDAGRPFAGANGGRAPFFWQGSFGWRPDRVSIPVPRGAVRAVLQVEKFEAGGTLLVDDVTVTEAAQPPASWTPYHVQDDVDDWKPYEPAEAIEPGSALDASRLVEAPAGQHGFVTVRSGRLEFEKGGRARFFGVVVLPPLTVAEPARADALADRLARSGVNLVRFDDLDAPFGPGNSLIDDTREDTRAFDPEALARFDHLVAALKKRGISIALEFLTARRFRSEDKVAGGLGLPPGGGPAAAFDPKIRALALETAQKLLDHVNPETGLALKDDPVLAWVVLAGELTLFDLLPHPDALPPDSAAILKGMAQKSSQTSRRFWQATESAQWQAMADALRKGGLKVPIAADSHWRRDPAEFLATLSAPGIDLIDDRLFWNVLPFVGPQRRAQIWDANGALVSGASRKRKSDRPYVLGQWCSHTGGAWALPYEGADLLLAAAMAAAEDWDALARRGVFLRPKVWGAAVTGTGGEDDTFPLPEVINANPQVFSLLPHAASIVLRDAKGDKARARGPALPGWDPKHGRLFVETPHTVALAGWPGRKPVEAGGVTIAAETPYAVVAVSSLGDEPVASARRLLVTAVARVEPTGIAWADETRREVAEPGRPPLLQEPVRAAITWKHRGRIKAYALDNSGKRRGEVTLEKAAGGAKLVLDGRTATVHWELVAE
jgi:hypothetical protein